jgi:hypothetical protein
LTTTEGGFTTEYTEYTEDRFTTEYTEYTEGGLIAEYLNTWKTREKRGFDSVCSVCSVVTFLKPEATGGFDYLQNGVRATFT